ncbi:S8 family serine peptidase [Castellaniella sp. GW247-6E4]|uniref:S8 family serine peptidase n=1 Tax=Castellaniella sp. GW247-6E4 TaxID=3140380 RepID=UPI003314FEAF
MRLLRPLALLLLSLGVCVPAAAAPGDLIVDPESFVDTEFRRSGALDLIRAQYAYARGYTGKGVLVAVLDSGLYAQHPEFMGRVAGGWNFRPDQQPWDYADTELDDEPPHWIEGHGTHVAGIIGAARDGVQMHGVAYEASLLGVRTDFDRDGPAFDYAIRAGAQVLNGSYGPSGMPPMSMPNPADPGGPAIPNPKFPSDPGSDLLKYQNVPIKDLQAQADMLRRAAAADIVMVFAAGNDYENYSSQASHVSGYGMYHLITPDFFLTPPVGVDPMFRFWDMAATPDLYDPATYVIVDFTDDRVRSLDFSDLGGSMLSVVAVGPGGGIASYSNRCGQAAMWCLAAPGGDGGGPDAPIYSTNPDPRHGYYVKMDGTSMASPVVAGAAAVLRQAFPYMSARQIIEVILTTTNDGGIYADETVYGRGLLDLGAAVGGPGEFGADGFAKVFRADTKGFDSQFSNDIEGDGGLVKAGAGTLILSGRNTYTGATVIEGGRLAVNGDTSASSFTVEAGGTLGGRGRVGSTEVYGRLAPGNSIDTLTVVGDYTQHPGSVLEIEVDAAGNSDRLDVVGNADLRGGEVELLGLSGGVLGREYAFMTVAGVIGGPGFAGVRDDYLFADLRLVPTGTGFRLAVDRSATTFAALGNTGNQRSAAQAIEGLGAGATPYEALIGLRDPTQAPGLYDQFSGELHATARSMLQADAGMVRAGVMGRLAMQSQAGPAAGSGLWGHAMTAWGRYDGAGVSQDASRFGSGFMIGRDLEWTQGLSAGLAVGYTRSRVRAELDNEATLDGYHVLAYGAAGSGPWRLRGGAGYSWFTVDTRRDIDAGGLGRQTARYGAWATQMFAEGGYALPVGSALVEPYVGVSQVWQGAEGFAEDGASPLSGRSGQDAFTRSALGARGYWRIETTSGELQLMAGLAWQHAYGDLSPRARLAYVGGADYELSGVPQARDALQVEVKASLARTRTARLELGYLGTIGGGTQAHGLRLQASYRF